MPRLHESSFLAPKALAESVASLMISTPALISATAGLQTPWLRIGHEVESMSGLAKVLDIGERLKDPASAFTDQTGSHLRGLLGDWRAPSALVDTAIELPERSALYESRGLDPQLTAFPAPAFRETIRIAQLDADPPTMLVVQDYGIPAGSP